MQDEFSVSFLRKLHARRVDPVTATMMLQKEAASQMTQAAVKAARIRAAIHIMPSLIKQ